MAIFIPIGFHFISYTQVKVSNSHRSGFEKALSGKLADCQSFDMEEVTDFEWDRMHVIYPYTSKAQMEEQVGTSWTVYSYLGYLFFDQTFLGDHPLDDESWNKIVFTRDGKVVLDVTFSRNEADFTSLQQLTIPDDSSFIVKDKRVLSPAEAGSVCEGGNDEE